MNDLSELVNDPYTRQGLAVTLGGLASLVAYLIGLGVRLCQGQPPVILPFAVAVMLYVAAFYLSVLFSLTGFWFFLGIILNLVISVALTLFMGSLGQSE
jgi:hypothetical protein